MTPNSSASSSPEFEFWMVRNRLGPTPGILTADELFVDGVILPLDFRSLPSPAAETTPNPPPSPPPILPPDPPPASIISSSVAPTSGSWRWKNLFKVAGEQKQEEQDKNQVKERKKERRSVGGSSTELNINLNIWPFSRSRSAGNTTVSCSRLRSATSISGRKTSSAPCSRSNSRGESSKPLAASTATAAAGRKWASTSGRGGVNLGRTGPVCQFRRSGPGPNDKARKPALPVSEDTVVSGVRVLNLNVKGCIGCRFRNQVSCREDGRDAVTGGECTMEGNPINGSVFSLRALFSKKVH